MAGWPNVFIEFANYIRLYFLVITDYLFEKHAARWQCATSECCI